MGNAFLEGSRIGRLREHFDLDWGEPSSRTGRLKKVISNCKVNATCRYRPVAGNCSRVLCIPLPLFRQTSLSLPNLGFLKSPLIVHILLLVIFVSGAALIGSRQEKILTVVNFERKFAC